MFQHRPNLEERDRVKQEVVEKSLCCKDGPRMLLQVQINPFSMILLETNLASGSKLQDIGITSDLTCWQVRAGSAGQVRSGYLPCSRCAGSGNGSAGNEQVTSLIGLPLE